MLITFKVCIIINSFWLCIYTHIVRRKGKKNSKNTLSEFVRINRMHNLWFHTDVSIYWVEWVCVERDVFIRPKWKKRERKKFTNPNNNGKANTETVCFICSKKKPTKKVNLFLCVLKIKMCFRGKKANGRHENIIIITFKRIACRLIRFCDPKSTTASSWCAVHTHCFPSTHSLPFALLTLYSFSLFYFFCHVLSIQCTSCRRIKSFRVMFLFDSGVIFS